jgi:Integrase core domain
MDPNTANILGAMYGDPTSSGGLGSIHRLYKAARSKANELRAKSQQLDAEARALGVITEAQVKQYLQSRADYGVHRQQRLHIPRRKVISYGINWLWEMDIGYLPKFPVQNDGRRYILVVIDVFSKYLWAVALTRKDAEHVRDGFETILDQARLTAPSETLPPKNLYSDRGGEFDNELFKQLTDSHSINHYFAYDDKTGAPTAERVLRTIKGRIWRYMTANQTRNYLKALSDIVHTYNHTSHRSIGMAPADVKLEHTQLLRERLYPDEECPPRNRPKPKLQIGDIVRTQHYFAPGFGKGYKPNQYSTQTYRIVHVQDSIPYTYKLVMDDEDGETEIMGSFYEQQLLLVNRPAPDDVVRPAPSTPILYDDYVDDDDDDVDDDDGRHQTKPSQGIDSEADTDEEFDIPRPPPLRRRHNDNDDDVIVHDHDYAMASKRRRKL